MHLTLISFILFLFSASPAQAYVDPGTASIALQALIGGIAAASLFFRSHISALLSKFWYGGRKNDDARSPVTKETNTTADANEKNER